MMMETGTTVNKLSAAEIKSMFAKFRRPETKSQNFKIIKTKFS